MKKPALLCMILLLCLCGCGKTYTLQEQQTEFRAWYQEFHQKQQTAGAIVRDATKVLASLRKQEITPEEADTKFKQFNEQFDQALQSFAQPPATKTLSKEDQQVLNDSYKDMAAATGYMKKLANDGLVNVKSPNNPAMKQLLLDEQKVIGDTVMAVNSHVRKVADELKIP